MQATLDDGPAGEVSDVPVELPVLVFTLDGVLLLIATTALLAIALLSLRERLRDFGVLKAIGLTPRQVASSLVAPYAALAVLAGVLSVPLGIALYVATYRVAGGDGDPTTRPGRGCCSSRSAPCSWWWPPRACQPGSSLVSQPSRY
jgi:FtsX-like permease family